MPTDRPNILVIWGDDIGITNLSCYSDGLMGYRTPNIDRIAEEGARFTDYYGEQSCTAGRAAFICGQNPIRTGLTKVGMPGATIGLQAEDPTIATALKAHGYATGQFGKNHLGDRDEHLPTVHGFDEFFGNLYHLNAEEEPELADYPRPEDLPNFRERFGPRGVIHSWANDDGTQRIEDTGPLTKKRMETVDDEFLAAALGLHPGQGRRRPAVLRVVQRHPHALPHARQAREQGPGRAVAVGVPRHDDRPRQARRRPPRAARRARHRRRHHRRVLDRQRAAHEHLAGRRDDAVPRREELELGGRLPGARRGAVARAGSPPARCSTASSATTTGSRPCSPPPACPTSPTDLEAGVDLDGTPYHVHLDGFDQLDYLTGATTESPRQYFFYVSDDGDLTAVRFDNWKLVFLEQRATGTLRVWAEPFTRLRVPKIFNLRTDPYERADITSNTYYDWILDHAWVAVPMQAFVFQMIQSFVEFPPRQKPASFSLEDVLAELQTGVHST